jgi:hypothetical protein
MTYDDLRAPAFVIASERISKHMANFLRINGSKLILFNFHNHPELRKREGAETGRGRFSSFGNFKSILSIPWNPDGTIHMYILSVGFYDHFELIKGTTK